MITIWTTGGYEKVMGIMIWVIKKDCLGEEDYDMDLKWVIQTYFEKGEKLSV